MRRETPRESRIGRIVVAGLALIALFLGALAWRYRPAPPFSPITVQSVPAPTSVIDTCPFHSFNLAAFKRVIGVVARTNPTLGTLNSMDAYGRNYLDRNPNAVTATFAPFTLTDPELSTAALTVTGAATFDGSDAHEREYGKELYLRVRFHNEPQISIDGQPVFYGFLSADTEPICRDHNLLEAIGHAMWFGARAQN